MANHKTGTMCGKTKHSEMKESKRKREGEKRLKKHTKKKPEEILIN